MSLSDAEKLGYACRFGGINDVRTLLKYGAKFETINGDPLCGSDYARSLLNVSKQLIHGACRLNRIEMQDCITDKDGNIHTLLPTSERIEIYRLLKENAEKCLFQSGWLYYYAILANDTGMIAAMRENGETFPEYLKKILIKGGRFEEWTEFCCIFEGMDAEEFYAVIENITRELGGQKLNFSEFLFCSLAPILYTTEGFEFILEHFNQQKIKKGRLMKLFIDNNKTALLEIASRQGWLKMPKKRDEMIQYAADNGKTEAAAWLLEFKNRTADLVKERKLAEKKMLRELNANPNSAAELKKSWSFVKNGSGTLTITRYKGNRTEVIVPEKIGKNAVTVIGRAAICGAAYLTTRVRWEQIKLRQAITRIVLPESIDTIGDFAFAYCFELMEVNIPRSVTIIGKLAFFGCDKLERLSIPETVTNIGTEIVTNTADLTVTVTKGSFAEEYCKENKIKFNYKE